MARAALALGKRASWCVLVSANSGEPVRRVAVEAKVRRVYLISPANVAGLRAAQLLNPEASFPLARKFRADGVSIGEVFTFLSALYFRGKIGYALRFARVEDGDVVRIITTNRGLLDPATVITPKELRAFGKVDIDEDNPNYRKPLTRDAKALAKRLDNDGEVVLLGSIATGKYREILSECFGDRLVFPKEFVGRGDMSRGGMLLRAVRDGEELGYQRVEGATLRGKRAVKLEKLPRRK